MTATPAQVLSELEIKLRDEYNFGLYMSSINNKYFVNNIYKIGKFDSTEDPDIYVIHVFRIGTDWKLSSVLANKKTKPDLLRIRHRYIFQLVDIVNLLHQSNIFNIYNFFEAEIYTIAVNGKEETNILLQNFTNTCTSDAKKLTKCAIPTEELRSADIKKLMNMILYLWFPDTFYDAYVKNRANSKRVRRDANDEWKDFFGTLELVEETYLKFLKEFGSIFRPTTNVEDFRKKLGTTASRNNHEYLSHLFYWRLCLNMCLWFESEILQKAAENKNGKKILEYTSYLKWDIYRTELGSNKFSMEQFVKSIAVPITDSLTYVPSVVPTGKEITLLDEIPSMSEKKISELRDKNYNYKMEITNYVKTPSEIKDKIKVFSKTLETVQAEFRTIEKKINRLHENLGNSTVADLKANRKIDKELDIQNKKLTELEKIIKHTKFALNYWKSKN